VAGGTLPTVLLAGCDVSFDLVPAPAEPAVQALLVTTRYLDGGYEHAIDGTLDDLYPVYSMKYTQGVALWGMLLLDEGLDRPACTAQVRTALEYYNRRGQLKVHGGSEPIDYIGAVALAAFEYSQRTGDLRFLDIALEAARFFHEDVARTPEGLIAYHSNPQRGRIWADALFMVTPLMAKAGAHLEDGTYYDDVLSQFAGFTARLRDADVGLYHQGWNWYGSGASPGYWGRANGWVALALVEVLDTIPADYPGYDDLLALYQDFMAAVVAHQGPTGMWHQLLNRQDSYAETSCTAMFIYALSRGLQRGWLDETYREALQRGYLGLSAMISLKGDLTNICPGTPTQKSEKDYLNRGPRRNDDHGVGPVMLALYGMLTLPAAEPQP